MNVPNPPRATVRLQFHAGFTLDDARATVPYYAALGVSHIYASPLLAARAGSEHGYDVIDPTRINPELGGIDALRRLVAALREHGMGLVLDIVPNHMAASLENPWWRDVLEWGRDSRYASYFDIDWALPDPDDPNLRGRVLMPALGRPRDDLLDDGAFRLQLDPDDGRIQVALAHQHFPLAATAYGQVLGGTGALDGQARAFEAAAAAADVAAFDRALAALHQFARTADGRATVDAALARYASTTPAGRERLDQLLSRQPYLLAPWTHAWHRINWRRFFDITDLVAIRPDRAEVFDATHALVLQLYAEGLIDGLRIDHIDGLVDPRGYCRQLRERMRELQSQRPTDAPGGPAWLIVEKILARDETLREDWPADGTTGYEFMDQVGAVLHDPQGAPALDKLWQDAAVAAHDSGASNDDDLSASYATQALAARRQMLVENFSADLDGTTRAVHALALRTMGMSAPPQDALRAALVELIVHFPVYRTYVSTSAASAGAAAVDAAVIAGAARAADRSDAGHDRALMAQLVQWLSGHGAEGATEESTRAELTRAVARFQRLTPPVAAKAIEDTLFYRYARLLSRNEVGSEPDHLALSVDGFNDACHWRQQHTPHTLLATATHDHKRGEDARARLAVLSELPEQWAEQVHRWQETNAGRRSLHNGGPAPDAADELTLYQTLVGAWPLALDIDDKAALDDLAERVADWQRKALREAKRHSAWSDPDEAYEAACETFLRACLSPAADNGFLPQFSRFVQSIAPAGAINGLSQTLLRLTTPGLPDLYQGTALWDFSMVDPDNRRPVDHDLRAAALAAGGRDEPAALLARWRDGGIKQQLIARALTARRAMPAVFSEGGYRPLPVRGQCAEHVIAFEREHHGAAAITVVPRLPWPLLDRRPNARPHIDPRCWQDTTIAAPPGRWRDALTGAAFDFGADAELAEVLKDYPVALLVRDP